MNYKKMLMITLILGVFWFLGFLSGQPQAFDEGYEQGFAKGENSVKEKTGLSFYNYDEKDGRTNAFVNFHNFHMNYGNEENFHYLHYQSFKNDYSVSLSYNEDTREGEYYHFDLKCGEETDDILENCTKTIKFELQ